MKSGRSLNSGVFRRLCGVVLTALLGLSGLAQANVYDEPSLHTAIPLLDEDGANVLVSGKSYSAKQSCGGCHDYESITHSFHFETGRDEAADDFGAKRGIASLVSSGYFGGYNCMGSNNPDQLAKKSNSSAHDFGDKGAAGWVQRCESCHTGGGWMERDRNGNRYDETDPATVTEFDGDYYNRGTDENNHATDLSVVSQWDWQKSGVVEADCFKCHADLTGLKVLDPTIDTSSASSMASNVRRGVLIDQGHFRESNTAILEVLNLNITADTGLDKTVVAFNRADQEVIEHDGTVIPPDGIISDKEVVFDVTTGEPQITWNAAAFDGDGKVEIPMLRFPGNDNCMACHRTSNSRRGFYGFGEDAVVDLDDDGLIIEDYQDDVHKGKTWGEANGEERTIENCNSCHARNYFNPASSSADVDANHNFLKGNSDMDVRNDLDFNPRAKSCEYCHNDSPLASTYANPSGYDDMLSAHQTRWTLGGDMFGYPADTLERVTQTHLDVVSCQACHITDKAVRGTPFEPMFRYREDENGKRTIVPYKPKPRYYWRDDNSGAVLTQTERNSVFEMRNVDAAGVAIDVDADGTTDEYGVIVDPSSGAELATVSLRYSHGSWRFGDPEDYDAFVGLKNAYDTVFAARGVSGSDAVLVWSEINQYLISHNTRPAISSVQCEECHNYKQDGSISSLVSVDGIFGATNTYSVTTVLDPRLVTEGIIVFDYPYMKMDEATGEVTATVTDILSHSRVDPSMSILRSAQAEIATGILELVVVADELAAAGLSAADAQLVQDQFAIASAYRYQATYGDEAIRDVLILAESNAQSDLLFPSYSIEVALADGGVTSSAAGAGLGGMVSGLYSLRMLDASAAEVSSFAGTQVLVKLPYGRTNTDLDQIRIITSSDGSNWMVVDPSQIVALQPQSDLADGYIVFMTDHFSYYAIADSQVTAVGTNPTSIEDGGGSTGLWLLLIGLIGLMGRGYGYMDKKREETGC